MIDRSGQSWTGEGFDDLAEYLRVVTADGYPADRILQAVCRCGGMTHHLDADPVESAAQCLRRLWRHSVHRGQRRVLVGGTG